MLIPLSWLASRYRTHITGVLHVGAHECEEREAYHHLGLKDSDIFWVEGNSDIVTRVQKNLGNSVQIYDALVSDQDGKEVDFIITNNGQSSSILELEEHKVEHPHVWEVDRYKKATTRLDSLIPREISGTFDKVNFLNLDIQGAELLALKGLGKYLDQMDYVYTEVNAKPLYTGAVLLPELDQFLQQKGFRRVETNMTHYGWGDAFYIRADSGKASH
jgi:FkbM family methyltransferase